MYLPIVCVYLLAKEPYTVMIKKSRLYVSPSKNFLTP
jgi:hypothetical protein